MKRSCLLLAVLTATCVGLLGCGGSTKLAGVTAVNGTVTQKGTPVAGATVTLVPTTQGARAASGITDATGKFTLTTLTPGDGAFPGDYQVTVTKMEKVGKEYTQEEANAYYAQNQTYPPSPETKSVLDAKYADAKTSGLKASVKKGEPNEIKLEIE
jgi:hypothetical protein